MVDIIPIADAEDPRVAAYREIRERDLVGRQGQFIAEGEVVLRVLAEHRGDLVQSLLIDGRRLDKLAPILAALPQATPVYVTEQGALDAIAGFHLHRGLLALGRKPADPGGGRPARGGGRWAGAGHDGHRQSRQYGRPVSQRRRLRGEGGAAGG